MYIELSKFVPISGKNQDFLSVKSCLKIGFLNFWSESKLLGPSLIDYKILRPCFAVRSKH